MSAGTLSLTDIVKLDKLPCTIDRHDIWYDVAPR